MPVPPLQACPCCGYATLPSRGAHRVCPVCTWEDDGLDNERAANFSAANAGYLNAARSLFLFRHGEEPADFERRRFFDFSPDGREMMELGSDGHVVYRGPIPLATRGGRA